MCIIRVYECRVFYAVIGRISRTKFARRQSLRRPNLTSIIYFPRNKIYFDKGMCAQEYSITLGRFNILTRAFVLLLLLL